MRPSTFSSGPKEGSHNETHNETVNIFIASLSEFSILKQESHNETVNIFIVSASEVSLRQQESHNETVNMIIVSSSELSALQEESHNETVNIFIASSSEFSSDWYCLIITVYYTSTHSHFLLEKADGGVYVIRQECLARGRHAVSRSLRLPASCVGILDGPPWTSARTTPRWARSYLGIVVAWW